MTSLILDAETVWPQTQNVTVNDPLGLGKDNIYYLCFNRGVILLPVMAPCHHACIGAKAEAGGGIGYDYSHIT